MKNRTLRRTFALLLAMILCLSAVTLPAYAAQEPENVRIQLEKVSNDEVPLELDPSRSYTEAQTADYSVDGPVRVSILLKSDAALDLYPISTFAASGEAVSYRQQLRAEQDALAQEISTQVLGGSKLDVVWNLTLAANIISANVEYDKLEDIRALPQVEAVVVERCYQPHSPAETLTTDPNMATSADMIGSGIAYETGYTGAGTRIAVIDTGIDADHQSFDGDAFEYALSQLGATDVDLLDAAEVAKSLDKLNIAQNGVTAADLYRSAKLPFAYNYVDKSLDVSHLNDAQSEHGSHVAGIAAANSYIPDSTSETGYSKALDKVLTQGVAPEAQLMVMKVFGASGGAYDSDYLAAIEDALVLGADSINLSLGSSYPGPSSYTTYMGESSDPVPVYQAILDSLQEKDAVVTISAGNSGSWAENSSAGAPDDWSAGVGLLYDDGISMDVVGAPGSFTNAFTVTSVDNIGNTGEYISVNDQKFIYMETTGSNSAAMAASMKSIAGDYEYIYLTGYGDYVDFYNVSDVLTDKVVFCSRGGGLDFSYKASNASYFGVAATIIYNNVPGSLNMDLSSYWGTAPCVFVTQDTANAFLAAATPVYAEDGTTVLYYKGKMTISANAAVMPDTAEYPTMSSFASWGVPGSLELKPELTAPGGNIYSVFGRNSDNYGNITGGTDQYENMSGTSMAAPQIAGMSALFAQHYQAKGLSSTGVSVRHLAQSLLMSTAAPALEAEGQYWSVLKQGAGIANIGAAINAHSYIMMSSEAAKGAADGKVKAELGEDANKTGVYSFSFTINDLSGKGGTYDLSASFFTQAMTELEGQRYLAQETAPLDTTVTWSGDASGSTVTVPAGGKATVTVTAKLTDTQKAALNSDYPVGAYVEGFVYATERSSDEGVSGTAHSIPVLAFYGSWTQSSMFDVGSYYLYATGEETRMPYLGSGYKDNNALYVAYHTDDSMYPSTVLGGNPMITDSKYMPQRNAINGENGDTISLWKFAAIRNVAESRLQIKNVTANTVLEEQTLGHFLGAFYATYFQPSEYVQLPLDWQPAGLTEGTQLELSLTLSPEYYLAEDGSVDWSSLGAGASLIFPLTIDNTAPMITSVTVNDDETEMTVTAWDNQYVSAVYLYDRSGTVKLAQAGANQTTDADAYNDYVLDLSNANGNIFYVKAYDYALNAVTYRVTMELGEQPGEPSMFVYDSFYNGPKVWASMSGSGNVYVKTPYSASQRDYYAAAYVKGMIFAASTQGQLYVLDPVDPEDGTFVCSLGTTVLDMAYDQSTGTLYALDNNSFLYTVDLYTGSMTVVGALDSGVTTLACDNSGNLYYANAPGAYSYYDIYCLPIAVATGESEGEAELVTSTDAMYYPSYQEGDYSAAGSLEWDPAENVLFFATGTAMYKVTLGEVPGCQACLPSADANWWEDYYPVEFHALCIPYEGGSWEATDEVYSVVLSENQLDLISGKTSQLSASVLPWNLTDRSVIWTSSDETVATVDENGLVTALGEGECVITATSAVDATAFDECIVTVERLNVTLTGMLQDSRGNAQMFSWNLEKDETWTGGVEVDTSMATMAYDPVDSLYYVIDATDRSMTDDFTQQWRMHQVDTDGVTLDSAENGLGVPFADMAYSSLFSAEDEPMLLAVYRSGYVFTPFDPMDTSELSLSAAISLPTFNHYAQNLLAVASLGVETHSSEAWNDGETDWYGELVNAPWSGEVEAEHFAILDDAGYMWDLWISETETGYGFDYTSVKTPLANLDPVPFDSTYNYTYCSMIAGENGDLYVSRFNGKTNELYRLRKDGETGEYAVVLLGNFGASVWPALLGGVETNPDPIPSTPLEPAKPTIPTPELPVKPNKPGSGSGSGSSQLDKLLDSYVEETESSVSFSDVAEGSWYHDYVMDLVKAGVINGYPDGTFRPNGEVTWGEALKLVMKAVGYGDFEAANGHWAGGYMAKALEDLLISSEVDLNAPITRAEMANLVANALKLAPSDNAYPFEDYAPEAAVALYAAGIITGSLDNGHLLFRADSTITRAEMAAIIWRVYNK